MGRFVRFGFVHSFIPTSHSSLLACCNGLFASYLRGRLVKRYDLGIIIYYLGVLEEQQGRYSDALSRFRSALKLFRDSVGPDHRDTAEVSEHLID